MAETKELQDLLDLQTKIQKAETKLTELQAKESLLLQQLKKDFGYSSIAEAKTGLEDMELQSTKLKERLDKQVKKLETQQAVIDGESE